MFRHLLSPHSPSIMQMLNLSQCAEIEILVKFRASQGKRVSCCHSAMAQTLERHSVPFRATDVAQMHVAFGGSFFKHLILSTAFPIIILT